MHRIALNILIILLLLAGCTSSEPISTPEIEIPNGVLALEGPDMTLLKKASKRKLRR